MDTKSEYGKWKFCTEQDIRDIVGDNNTTMKISVMADVGRTNYEKDIIDKKKSIRGKLECNTLNEDGKENLYNELSIIRKFLQISAQLELSKEEKNIIKNQVLIVAGDMGTGKTQLLANSAKEYIDNENLALLSLGQMYISEESIENQFVKCIRVH